MPNGEILRYVTTDTGVLQSTPIVLLRFDHSACKVRKFLDSRRIVMKPALQAMTGKFSLTDTRGRSANRVRENQRRHRARVKAYISDLELRLEKSENRLAQALSQLEEMKRLVHNRHCEYSCPTKGQDQPLEQRSSLTGPTESQPGCYNAISDREQPVESTTLCSQAFEMISQQNFRRIDDSVIYENLRRGFRGGEDPAAGCSVNNGVLFAVLDDITGD